MQQMFTSEFFTTGFPKTFFSLHILGASERELAICGDFSNFSGYKS